MLGGVPEALLEGPVPLGDNVDHDSLLSGGHAFPALHLRRVIPVVLHLRARRKPIRPELQRPALRVDEDLLILACELDLDGLDAFIQCGRLELPKSRVVPADGTLRL
eukprot:CAMPEP_0179102256 /NCGR_PEP_ID=MMETSP0796-20121207/47319_1 /TAXON_ID=73915 /ORGANISM="Pyrodinium bahamense, Strain pbaha01" /LENGTH=106 /DNA_ID=CAMNT_0020800127 /DNA_START=83 /DNA_END=399 /DNA_ORIENTATION=+